MSGKVNAKQLNGLVYIENGGTNNDTYTNNTILIYGTQSIISSTYSFNDGATSSSNIWSAQKIVDYVDTEIDISIPKIKSGIVNGASFTGNPKKTTVTFSSAFASNNYSVVITGETNRTYTIESKSASSFVINANANGSFTNNVFWQCIETGEIN